MSCCPGDDGSAVKHIAWSPSLMMVEHLSSHHTLTRHLGSTAGGKMREERDSGKQSTVIGFIVSSRLVPMMLYSIILE